MTSNKNNDSQHPHHRRHHDSKRHRRPTINYPNPGPYKSRTCASRSSRPVTPWTNPRRSPYCSRSRAEEQFAYEPNSLAEQLEAERRQEEEGIKEDWLEDSIPPVVRQREKFGKFWINPHATNPTIRDPHYFKFPEGLPRCGFRNCTWKHDLKRHTGDEDFGNLGGGHRNFYDEGDNRPFKRRKVNKPWDAMPEENVGVLAYDDEPYVVEEGKDTS